MRTVRKLLCFTICYSFYSPAASAHNTGKVELAYGTDQVILAEKKQTKTKRKSEKKNEKKSAPKLEAPPPIDVSSKKEHTSASGILVEKTFRGLLGLAMGGKMALIFGGAGTMPYSKTMVLDGGFDYLKSGGSNYSISMMRFGAGATYIISATDETVMRAGGRAGLASISASVVVPAEFEGDADTTATKSAMSLFGEARAAYEKKFGSLIVGGEIQLPIFFSASLTGTKGFAIYGSVGKSF